VYGSQGRKTADPNKQSMEHNLQLVSQMTKLSDPSQIDQLVDALLKQVASMPKTPRTQDALTQGSVYVYQIPGIKVTLVSSPNHPLSKESWHVVKVGISKPGKLATRLLGEGELWRNHSKLSVLIPGFPSSLYVPGNENNVIPVSPTKAKKWTNLQLTEHVRANYATFKDVLCIQPVDIGLEDAISSYPSGIGINIGKVAKLATEVPNGFKFSTGNAQKKTLTFFFRNEALVPEAEMPSTSWGETEFVIMPGNLIALLVEKWKNNINITTFLEDFQSAYNGLQLQQITLARDDHPTHKSLVFVKGAPMWPK
jgi:hypothetical protein